MYIYIYIFMYVYMCICMYVAYMRTGPLTVAPCQVAQLSAEMQAMRESLTHEVQALRAWSSRISAKEKVI